MRVVGPIDSIGHLPQPPRGKVLLFRLESPYADIAFPMRKACPPLRNEDIEVEIVPLASQAGKISGQPPCQPCAAGQPHQGRAGTFLLPALDTPRRAAHPP